MKTKRIVTSTVLVALLLISQSSYALGWEVTSQNSYLDGRCAVIETTETFYFLGIAWSTRTTSETVCTSDPSFYTPKYY
jgi:hypothetical protein